MVTRRKLGERKVPQIDGVWRGAASLELIELLRDQWFSMEQIADAFGVSRKTLYNRINKAKAADSRTSNGLLSPLSSPQDDRQRLGSKNESQSVPDQAGAA